MKDFSAFEKFCNENLYSVLFDITNGLEDVSEDKRTLTEEEWIFIQKLIVKSNLTFLRWYHDFFFEELHE